MTYAILTKRTKETGNSQRKSPGFYKPRSGFSIPSGTPLPKLLKAAPTLRSILITKTRYSETPRNLDENLRNVS
jgi:hypothetical protein